LRRRLDITETPRGTRISLDYRLTNTGTASVPWSWAAHPLFTVEEGDRIILPDSIHTLRLEGSGGDRLGKRGAEIQWPIADLANGFHADLSRAEAPDSGIGDKLFAGPMHPDAALCALERPSAGVRLNVTFDANATPYLGLWLCYGGWPARPGPKQVCVALEPATAPVDSLAFTGPWSRTLAPGAWFDWPMQVDIEIL
jgi:galactose mutarotase-like enzyme